MLLDLKQTVFAAVVALAVKELKVEAVALPRWELVPLDGYGVILCLKTCTRSQRRSLVVRLK